MQKNRRKSQRPFEWKHWSLIPPFEIPSYLTPVAIVIWLAMSFVLSWARDLAFNDFVIAAAGGVFSLLYIESRFAREPAHIDEDFEDVTENSPFHVRFFWDLFSVLSLALSLWILLWY